MSDSANTNASGQQRAGAPAPDDATVVGATGAITPTEFPQGLTTRELAHALRGEMLDHFHLQEFVGGGGMGVVFRALDTTLDRVVAVKVVASHQLSGEDLQRRFLVEAQSTARLDHPNIARVHYIGRDLGLPYIVFEYIDGVNVRDLVATRGPLAVADAVSYTYQIAHALAHAWQRDVVHRDIKPSNILVTVDGQAKLVDMGLARLTLGDGLDDDLTATGVTLGTFDYISPEQARDSRDADTRSDIYSLGCSLYYMLAGQAPFSSERAVQKLIAHQTDPPPEVRTVRPDAPEAIAKMLNQMLAKSPKDRPANPIELVELLTRVAERLDLALPSSLTPPPAPPRRARAVSWQRHLAWAIPLSLAFAAAGVADRWLAGEPKPFLKLRIPQNAATNPATNAENVDAESSDMSVDSKLAGSDAGKRSGTSEKSLNEADGDAGAPDGSGRRRTSDAAQPNDGDDLTDTAVTRGDESSDVRSAPSVQRSEAASSSDDAGRRTRLRRQSPLPHSPLPLSGRPQEE